MPMKSEQNTMAEAHDKSENFTLNSSSGLSRALVL
jgi:hypothetical protein